MKEHEDRYVAVIEKHTLDGANTINLMKHKHRYVTLVKRTRTSGAIAVAVMFSTAALCFDEIQVDRSTKFMFSLIA